ncbi:MAG: type 4a pilus biogenesis protein PilO [Candidatus Aminicenantes bacterium]|nr:type 4a pilus biogenesis protein PilO [Candidatus Aminicenantes bacterium]
MKDWPWYGFVILGGILLLLVYIAYLKPKSQQLKDIRQEREKIENEVRDLRKKKRDLSNIEAQIKVLNEELAELETKIPRRKELSDIVKRFQKLASDSRLNIIAFNPREEVKMDFYREWPLPLEVVGNYHNLAIFFDQLSRFPRLFNVTEFNIRSLRNQNEVATISAALTAKTYIFIEETETQVAQK